MSARAPALALALGCTLMLVAWAMAQPPFRAPDEVHHYVRALSVSEGDLIGDRARYRDPALTRVQAMWANQTARRVKLPRGLAPLGEGTAVTPVGAYQPLPYLLPALGLRGGRGPDSGTRLARLAGMLACLALLLLAGRLVWDRGRPASSLAGLTFAATPMVLYTGASLNGSGLEIAAGLATAAGLLRLGRIGPAPGWVWGGLAFSGAALALSRSTGALWLAVLVACAALLHGIGPLLRALRERRAAGLATGCVWALACGLALAWDRAYGAEAPIDLAQSGARLADVPAQTVPFLRSVVGQFGYLDVAVPDAVHVLWGVLVLALLAMVFRFATGRERLGLLGVAALTALVPLFLMVAVQPGTGFPLQGRHVLPVLVALPLAAGEILRGHAAQLPGRVRQALAGGAAAAAAVHAVAFFVAARFEAGGSGFLWLFRDVTYEPPAGWLPWLAMATLGSALAALGLLSGVRRGET